MRLEYYCCTAYARQQSRSKPEADATTEVMMEMSRHLSLMWLFFVSSCLYPAAGFVPILPIEAGKLEYADYSSTFNSAALESSAARASTAVAAAPAAPTTPAAAAGGGEGREAMRCSLRRITVRNDCRRGRGQRRRQRQRRHPLTVLSAALGAGVDAAAAAEVEEEVAYEPGCELAPQEPAVQAFEAWAVSAGCRGNSASLSHADFEGLRGILTKIAVEPWQPIATVPASLFLQEDLLCSSPPSGAAAPPVQTSPQQQQLALPPPAPLSVETWHRCPWWVRLGVRLLKEKFAGEDSRLKEYVGMLPSPGETGTPMNWSAEQLGRLHYPRLLSQVKLQRRLFKGFQKLLLADATRGENEGEGDSGSSLVDALGDSASFNWALECVLSRAFQLPPDDAAALVFGEGDDTPVKAPALKPPVPEATRMALLPLIDSINHYSRVPTHMYWEVDGALSLSVASSFDPGDHAFASYGPVSNDDLLQYYGFVERDNPSDAYVLEDMGKWLREDALLGAELSTRLLACSGAREVWRYLRRGVILRDAVHPTTMQALRIVSCEAQSASDCGNPSDGGSASGESNLRWDGTKADLSRFATPVSLASETATLELLMRYCAREADAWGEAGVAAALAEDPRAPGLDGDLDRLGLDTDRRLMLSVFRQEKVALLRSIVGRLTHMRKVSDLLQRPIKMPVNTSPPAVLGPVGGTS